MTEVRVLQAGTACLIEVTGPLPQEWCRRWASIGAVALACADDQLVIERGSTTLRCRKVRARDALTLAAELSPSLDTRILRRPEVHHRQVQPRAETMPLW